MVHPTCFCDHCGAGNSDQATVCFACGQPLHDVAPGYDDDQTPQTTPLAGKLTLASLLKQRYRIVSLLGKGGFGAVYKAQDTQFNNRLVAIKEMSRHNLTTQELHSATEAFKTEAQLLAGLIHPNLPRIYDQFSEQGSWYLVMDFIEGETLSEYLTRKGVHYLPIIEVLEIGVQVCSVISYLHMRQPPIIFRDLKPDNIMRTPDGQIYLIDFGIARHFKLGQIKDTIALGSPGYAAPEQYGKAQTTPGADIYGLGATLHALLSGEDPTINPFRFASLRECPQDVPAELDTLITKMLNMDTHQRPSDSEVMQELKRIATSWSETKNASTLPASRLQQSRIQAGIPASSSRQDHLQQSTVSSLSSPSKTRYTSRRRLFLFAGCAIILVLSIGFFSRFTQTSYNSTTSHHVSANTSGSLEIHPLYTLAGTNGYILSISWSPNGKYIAGTDGGSVLVWHSGAESKAPSFIFNACQDNNNILNKNVLSNSITDIAWSPDNSRIALSCYDGTVSVWNMTTKKIVLTYRENSLVINRLAWSSDGKYIASASDDWTVQVWDTTTERKLTAYSAHEEPVTALAWSPNGKVVASGGYDDDVKIWNPTNGRTLLIYNAHRNWITAITWSPESSRIASSDANGIIHVWSTKKGDDITAQNTGARVYGMAWSPNGKFLAAGSEEDPYNMNNNTYGLLQIWNTTDWSKASATIWNNETYAEGDDLSSLTWSPDSKELAYASAQTIQVIAA